jgi:hypothetical protein
VSHDCRVNISGDTFQKTGRRFLHQTHPHLDDPKTPQPLPQRINIRMASIILTSQRHSMMFDLLPCTVLHIQSDTLQLQTVNSKVQAVGSSVLLAYTPSQECSNKLF